LGLEKAVGAFSTQIKSTLKLQLAITNLLRFSIVNLKDVKVDVGVRS